MPLHRLSKLTRLALSAVALASPALAENVPLDNPVSAVVRKYLEAMAAEDWKTTATMLLPTSLERKHKETLAYVKMAPTMSDETAVLSRLGIGSLDELKKMSPQDLYVADHNMMHKRLNLPENVKKRMMETLKIDLIGLCSEDQGRVMHCTVRTSQESLDAKVEKLFLISLVQDKDDPAKWLIVPDMMRTLTTPLSLVKEAEGAKTEDKPAEPAAPGKESSAPAKETAAPEKK